MRRTLHISIAIAAFWSYGCSTEAQTRNGFDVSTHLIPLSKVRGGGPPKDGIPALTNPEFISPIFASYLKSDDLVIGLERNGESKAYPLRILVWHEIANDTIGGFPVAVTYCPLCQSALVFDRKVGGVSRDFGVSGLLYNSNVLLYDRNPDHREESLWSQIEMRAVSGPSAKAGHRLTLLPSELTTWEDWKDRHPDTVVLAEETGHSRNYRGTAYARYFSTDNLMFPVEKKIDRPSSIRNKTLVAVAFTDGGAKAYYLPKVIKAAGEKRSFKDSIAGTPVVVSIPKSKDTFYIRAIKEGEQIPVAYMFWFAFSAMVEDVDVFVSPAN